MTVRDEFAGKQLRCPQCDTVLTVPGVAPPPISDSTATTAAADGLPPHCDNLQLFALYNLPRISQVYIMYHGTLRDGEATAGDESLEVKLFKQGEIPWDELAFPVVVESLKRYFEDRKKAAIQIHIADIHGRPGSKIEIVRY